VDREHSETGIFQNGCFLIAPQFLTLPLLSTMAMTEREQLGKFLATSNDHSGTSSGIGAARKVSAPEMMASGSNVSASW
jgi:hypothetical protein